jgi:AcrR family transcriptional regulator
MDFIILNIGVLKFMKNVSGKGALAREAISKAAVDLFSRQGYTGTTMRDIAAEVGLLPGSLYAHIKNKEELLAHIVENGMADFLAIEEEVKRSNDPADVRIRRAVASHVKFVADDPERMLIVFHQWRYLSGKKRDRAVEMRHSYELIHSNLLQEGIDEGIFRSNIDVKVEVYFLLGALNWIPEWYRSEGKYSPNDIAKQVSETYILAMRKK